METCYTGRVGVIYATLPINLFHTHLNSIHICMMPVRARHNLL